MTPRIDSITAVTAPDSGGSRRFSALAQPAREDGDSAQTSDLQQAVQRLREHYGTQQAELSFRIDEDSGSIVVSVLAADGTLLRQIPSEEALHIARMLQRGDPALIQTIV